MTEKLKDMDITIGMEMEHTLQIDKELYGISLNIAHG